MSRFSKIKLGVALAAMLMLPGMGWAADTVSPLVWLDRTWGTEEGLPDSNITGVEQSRDGYLWVATLGGLMRFNGSRFEDFSKEFTLQHIPNVKNRVVRKMFSDRRGRLWLVMDRGVVVCVGQNSARAFTAADGLPDLRVLAMAEDRDGAVWLAYAGFFCRIDGEKITQFGNGNNWPAAGTSWLAADTAGKIWLVRGAHVGVLEAGEWKEVLTLEQAPLRLAAASAGGMWLCTASDVFRYGAGGELKKCARLPDKTIVSALLESRDGALWIGTEADGLLRLQGETIEHVPTSHPEISCLTEDSEGNLWVGTGGGGLNLLRSQAMHLLGRKEGLPGESIRSVCQETNGELWVAMNNGALAHGHENAWHAMTAADGWSGGIATCVAGGHEGGVWIGTRDRGLQFFHAGKFNEWGRNQGLGSVSVRSLLASSQGDLWIATDGPNQLLRFRDGKFEVLTVPGETRSLRALAEGIDGTIWVGTSDGQLFRVRNQSLVSETTAREERPLSIRSLHATADGSLWIGYAGWGIGRLWNSHYTRITMKEGLFDDYISQILSDGNGGLWLNSNHGLFQVRRDELMAVTEGRSQRVRSIVYGKNEGLPSIQPTWDNSPAVCRSAQGQLWFTTRNGLLNVQPERIQANSAPPPVMFERVAIDDATVALRDAHSPLRGQAYTNCLDLSEADGVLRMSPGYRKIEFEFTALSFSSPENVHFRYRLKNFDNEWTDADAPGVAKYPQLSPGQYEFQVQACNNAGDWSQAGVRLNLVVSPFYWQTWPFQLGVLVVFTASIIGLVRYFSFRRLRRKLEHLEQQAALQRERTRIARDMHDEVGSKLSRLSLLSEMASQQPEMSASARNEAAEISETARDTIRSFEEIVWAVNPKNDSLTHLMNYLCRFAEEFFEGSGTQCVFDLPNEIPDIELPTGARHHIFLAAKEALNNVFKHAKAKQVCVRLGVIGGGVEIVIEDDGRGCDEIAAPRRAGTGNGLENMRERMKQAGGQFEMQSHAETGTRVMLRLNCS